MINYSDPRFSGALVAKACGLPVTTFRTLFRRGHFRIVGSALHVRQRDANGLPHLFSLRDAILLAVAARVMKATPAAPKDAFDIGIDFAHSGGPERDPAAAFNFRQNGYTLLAYFPDTGAHRLLAEERDKLSSLVGEGAPRAVTIININCLLEDVLLALGLDAASAKAAFYGSPPVPEGHHWFGGELVG